MRQRSMGASVAVSFLAASLIVVTLSWGTHASTAPPDFAALLRDRPYLTLFTQADDCSQIRSVNSLTGTSLDSELDRLSRWYAHFHAESSNAWPFGSACEGPSATTLAAKLVNRGAWVSNYRNGSYVSQARQGQVNFDEAETLERGAPLSIGTFWPGNYRPGTDTDAPSGARLAQDLSAGDTVVKVEALPTANRPQGSPATWPFMNSRGTGLAIGTYSQNTHDIVSWVRVGDELMQVVADPTVSNGIITLQVSRGLWGTSAVTHSAAGKVMAPVYIGSTAAASSDTGLNGAPSRNDTQAALRYGVKIWQQGGYGWISDRIAATFGSGLQGYNAIWLDVSSCNMYNNAAATGDPVYQWNDPAGAKQTRTSWGAAQKAKVDGLRSRFPGVRLLGNSLGIYDPCQNDLLSTTYDGGAIENYLKYTDANFDWQKYLSLTLDTMKNDWPAMFWVRWNYAFGGDVAQYKRFSYGAVLLANRSTATRFQYGGPFGLSKPDDLYLWNWGTPSSPPSSAADLAVGTSGLLRRDYANGIVLVNPTASTISHDLNGTFYDVVHEDSSGLPSAVSSVTIGAHDAAFLLRPGTSSPSSSPTASASPSPTTSASPPPSPSSAPTSSVSPGPSASPSDPASTPASPTGTAQPDTQPPVTIITSPKPGKAIHSNSVTLKGSAKDDHGVASVQVAFHDVDADTWLQTDGAWGTRSWFTAYAASPGALTTGWTYVWSGPTGGNYEVFARSTDTSGNVEPGPPSVRFLVARK